MNLNLIKLTPEQREALFPTQKSRISTLEQLAAWLLFSLAIITVYGLLSMTWAHARDIPPPDPAVPDWVLFFTVEQPTFAQTDYLSKTCGLGDDPPEAPYGGCLSQDDDPPEEAPPEEGRTRVQATEDKNLEQCMAHPERPVCAKE